MELVPDTNFSRTVADIQVNLRYDGALKSGQYHYITFEVVDANGQVISEDVGINSGSWCNLYIIDENLKTFFRPDFIDHRDLEFTVNFPEPGKYKVWFEFLYDGRKQHVSYVLEVE